MIIRCLVLFIPIVFAQIPPQPIVTTSSACLNNCLQQGSLIFAAANLRNFQKIILNIDQFCDTYEQLVKCAQSCSDEERQNLAQRIVLSAFICKDKLEEFRLVKECVQGQETDYVNQCSNDCGHPSTSTIQLDSSPSAAVNPFAFFDSITPVCRTMECIVKCSITESNKKCAGSGDLFRDIGFKQVMEASERLHNDLFNSSSSVAQQLAKIYVEALPEQCAYIIDPVKYDTMFAGHGGSGSEAVTAPAAASDAEGNTAKPSSTTVEESETKPTTTETFSANNDDVITRIFDVQIETKPTETPLSTATHTMTTVKEAEQETVTTAEPVNVPDTPLESPTPDSAPTTERSDSVPAQPETPVQIQIQQVPSHMDVEHIPEQEEQPTTSATTSASAEGEQENKEDTTTEDHEEGHEVHEHDHEEPEEEKEEHESMITSASDEATTVGAIHKSNESEEETADSTENVDLQHLATPATTQETERTIMVVNEDNDHEIDTNTVVHQEHNVPEQQKDLKKSGMRERTTLLLVLILPLLLFCFFSQ